MTNPEASSLLTPRWYPLRWHPIQRAYWESPHRFNLLPCGRRSGKTENAKRKLVKRALQGSDYYPARYFAAAPTFMQAKGIFFNDLLALLPREFITGISKSELSIKLINGSEIVVVGLDRPARLEGMPWDGGVIDEIANVKEEAWPENIRPVLSDRNGWCDLIGVPEGRGAYYRMVKHAEAELMQFGLNSEWGVFHWKSADILPAKEIESARRSMDATTFQQEYEASFVSFEGRIYYTFDSNDHCAKLFHLYNSKQPLIISLDFNVAPGVATISQEMTLPNGMFGTGAIGEVYIDRGSNTPAVCRKLAADWGSHEGRVLMYGDATGGAQGSAKVAGSDWEIVAKELRPVFGGRLEMHIPSHNPAERSRVNAVNTRFKSADGAVRAMVDPFTCPHLVEDLEGVRALKGGSGEIDKKIDPKLTHACFSAGTLIDTDKGMVPVENLPETGMVRTWDGSYVPYDWAGKTLSNTDIVSVSISDGTVIYCTPTHQWLTEGGWKCASELSGLELKSWQSKLSQIPSRTSTGLHTTSRERSLISSSHRMSHRPTFIGASGFGTMGQSLRECIFITKTAIEQTIRSIIWNASPLPNMLPIMRQVTPKEENKHVWRGWNWLVPVPLNGTDHQRVWSGIDSKAMPCGGEFTIETSRPFASIVARSIFQQGLVQNKLCSVARLARHAIGTIAALITKTERVPIAKTFSPLTNTARSCSVLERAQARLFVKEVRDVNLADVYCLHVPSTGCFALANGAIVSNSDAFGYYIAKEFPVTDGRMRKGRARV